MDRGCHKGIQARGNWMCAQFQVTLLSALVLCLAARSSAQTVQPQVPSQASVLPSAVATPTPLEQLPPNMPIVVYDNGLLMISAYNSTLGDILQSISRLTGTDIDVPAQANERVVMRLGPGSACDVLSSLLAGSRFNYVLVGSATNPNALAKVLLFPKPAAEDTPQPAVSVTEAAPQPRVIATESKIAEAVSEEPKEGDLPVRAQQRMLQQRRQMIMQGVEQRQQSD